MAAIFFGRSCRCIGRNHTVTKLACGFAQPHWTLAHEIGCDGCRGTHYYARDDHWSFLDMILWSPPRGEKTTMQIRADSVRIANGAASQVDAKGIPMRHNAAQRTGVSDHLPLLMSLESTQKQ